MTMTSALMEILSGERVPKFMATMGVDGKPNVVPVISMMPWDEKTIVFGEFLMRKSKANLQSNPKLAGIVFSEDLRFSSFTGVFEGFVDAGPIVEKFDEMPMFRYNAYTRIRCAGIIKVDRVLREGKIGKPELLAEFAKVKAAKMALKQSTPSPKMPFPVVEKYDRITAVKVMARIAKDGALDIHPALSLQAVDRNHLIFTRGASDGALANIGQGDFVTTSLITMDPVAYQVKGSVASAGSLLSSMFQLIDVEEVFSASPPLPGERIDSDIRSVPYRESGWKEGDEIRQR
jgi:hypothetical protein